MFKGVLISDHTPQMSCDGAWYSGMAYVTVLYESSIGCYLVLGKLSLAWLKLFYQAQALTLINL